MKSGHPKLSFIVPSILTAALTLSPVMAQNATVMPSQPSQSKAGTEDETKPIAAQPAGSTAAVNADGMPILYESPSTETGEAFPNVPKRSTAVPLSAPAPSPRRSEGTAQSKWPVTALLIGAATVVAIILLWPHHKKVGTVLAPGTPTVVTPAR
jgi:hypothetical protein